MANMQHKYEIEKIRLQLLNQHPEREKREVLEKRLEDVRYFDPTKDWNKYPLPTQGIRTVVDYDKASPWNLNALTSLDPEGPPRIPLTKTPAPGNEGNTAEQGTSSDPMEIDDDDLDIVPKSFEVYVGQKRTYSPPPPQQVPPNAPQQAAPSTPKKRKHMVSSSPQSGSTGETPSSRLARSGSLIRSPLKKKPRHGEDDDDGDDDGKVSAVEEDVEMEEADEPSSTKPKPKPRPRRAASKDVNYAVAGVDWESGSSDEYAEEDSTSETSTSDEGASESDKDHYNDPVVQGYVDAVLAAKQEKERASRNTASGATQEELERRAEAQERERAHRREKRLAQRRAQEQVLARNAPGEYPTFEFNHSPDRSSSSDRIDSSSGGTFETVPLLRSLLEQRSEEGVDGG